MRTIASALALLLGLLAAGCNGELVGGGQTPAKLVVVSGDLQSAPAGEELPQPLVVRVVDDANRPVANQLVNFVVTAGGGSVFAGAALTNAQGEARERWRLGTVAGDTQRVEARAVDAATGEPLVFAHFRAVATAGPAASIGPAANASYIGLPMLPLADSVAALVRDQYGNPVAGQTVAWSVAQGGGSASPASSVTDANGVARTSWTLGSQFEGTQVLQAAAGVALTTQFTANVQVPAGAVLVKVSGDGQNGVAGEPLAQPLVVRVQHADGRPIAGIPVTFSVAAIYGSVSPATSVSDANGQVTVQWTLGAFPYGVRATASIPSAAAEVAFTATSSPGPVAELRKTAGDAQTGRAGSVLADSLEVQAVDRFFNRVPGVTVTWSAPAGSVSPATAVTRADGTARAAFTLPAAAGQATAQASVPGAAPVAFTALATSSPVYMRILQPTANSLWGDTLRVVVAIDSANASISSVQATAGGRTVTLQPVSGTLRGTLLLDGTPAGPMELRVRAQTVNGDTAAVTATFIHDQRPNLTVSSPGEGAVVRNEMLRLDADCTDDAPGGCASITATAHFVTGSRPNLQLASGTSGIHTTVPLAGANGLVIAIGFTATDSRGQTRHAVDTVYVEGSQALTEVASGGSEMWDVDGSGRALYSDTAGALWTRAGGSETLVAAWAEADYARLHPLGAIFYQRYGADGGRLVNKLAYDWRGGALVELGPVNAEMMVSGSWAIWTNSRNLYRRDLTTGTTIQLSSTAGNDRNDVTSSGQVAYWTGPSPFEEGDVYDIYLFDGTGTTRLTSDADSSQWNILPVTDGTSVLYTTSAQGGRTTTQPGRIALWRDGVETLLTSTPRAHTPHASYEAEGGWIAWVDEDAGGILQIHTRSPGGVDRRATSGGTGSALRALLADGTVIYVNGGAMYAIRAPYTGTPVRVASDWGSRALRVVGGDVFLVLGRSAFRVNY
jgi:hypothetical protein